MRIFCELRGICPSPAGARKNTSNEQNVRSYDMLNHWTRGLLFHYKKKIFYFLRAHNTSLIKFKRYIFLLFMQKLKYKMWFCNNNTWIELKILKKNFSSYLAKQTTNQLKTLKDAEFFINVFPLVPNYAN